MMSNKSPNLVRNQDWLRHQIKYCRSLSKIQRRLLTFVLAEWHGGRFLTVMVLLAVWLFS